MMPTMEMYTRAFWLQVVVKLNRLNSPIPKKAEKILDKTAHLGDSPDLWEMLARHHGTDIKSAKVVCREMKKPENKPIILLILGKPCLEWTQVCVGGRNKSFRISCSCTGVAYSLAHVIMDCHHTKDWRVS